MFFSISVFSLFSFSNHFSSFIFANHSLSNFFSELISSRFLLSSICLKSILLPSPLCFSWSVVHRDSPFSSLRFNICSVHFCFLFLFCVVARNICSTRFWAQCQKLITEESCILPMFFFHYNTHTHTNFIYMYIGMSDSCVCNSPIVTKTFFSNSTIISEIKTFARSVRWKQPANFLHQRIPI